MPTNIITLFYFFILGLIFFELLAIIPLQSWKDYIFDVRQGNFPPDSDLKEDEQNLIKELLTPDPENRPNDLDEIIDVTDYLMQTDAGKNVLSNYTQLAKDVGII